MRSKSCLLNVERQDDGERSLARKQRKQRGLDLRDQCHLSEVWYF